MILDTLAASSKRRAEAAKKNISPDEMKRKALAMDKGDYPFEAAMRKDGFSFICEVKRASPSKGMIAEDFPYLDIAKEYEQAGAAAISVLTEPEHFLGSNAYLTDIHNAVQTPLLRKDFMVDAYQIYEAKVIGAQAVLLICAILNLETLVEYAAIAKQLGLSALVETHTPDEIEMALMADSAIVGINNRDLKTFQVDLNNCLNLRDLVPSDRICVAESGVKTAADIVKLREKNFHGALIGETLMRSPDKKQALAILRGDVAP